MPGHILQWMSLSSHNEKHVSRKYALKVCIHIENEVIEEADGKGIPSPSLLPFLIHSCAKATKEELTLETCGGK